MKGLIFLLILGLMTSSALYAVNPVLDLVNDEAGINVVNNAEQGGWWSKAKSFISKTVNKIKNFIEDSDGKTMAIIAHLGLIGVLIAYLMNQGKGNELASFYIRQNLGIFLLLAPLFFAWIPFIGILFAIAGLIMGLFAFVLWIISLMGAIKGEEKLVPVVGKLFQKWFKNL